MHNDSGSQLAVRTAVMVVNGTASAHCAYLFFSTVTVPSNLCISTSLPDELRSGRPGVKGFVIIIIPYILSIVFLD